jgi:hypothetical protein
VIWYYVFPGYCPLSLVELQKYLQHFGGELAISPSSVKNEKEMKTPPQLGPLKLGIVAVSVGISSLS